MERAPLVVMPEGNGSHRSATLGRRELLLAALGLAGVGATAGLVRFLSVPERRTNLAASIYYVAGHYLPKPGDAPRYFAQGRFFLANLRPGEGGWRDAVVHEEPSPRGGLLALSERCPYLGCGLQWRADFAFAGSAGWFRCPCHGCLFTKAGRRVFGPAPRSMDTMPFTFEPDGGVLVQLKRIQRGGPDDPARAVPFR